LINVMIVEDDPMVAQLNKQYIELVEGFAVQAAVHKADEALAFVDTCEVDLVLLDLFMPDMNGIELLMKLREIGKGIDVIVVSAACDNATIMKVLRFGAIDYIIKPFEFSRLKDALMNYKGLISVMQEQNIMNQEDLDNYILYKEHVVNLQLQLPKGIDQNTLRRSWEKIQKQKQKSFSTEELASKVGISRVSMRKYLEFMRELGALDLKLIYGAVGRPGYQYHCTGGAKQIIARYV
jgi:two-component system, CitB family, response regulator MalR